MSVAMEETRGSDANLGRSPPLWAVRPAMVSPAPPEGGILLMVDITVEGAAPPIELLRREDARRRLDLLQVGGWELASDSQQFHRQYKR